MSQVDFSQDASVNASLYIAVLPLGEVTASLYSSVLDTLNSLSAYRPPDGKNNILHFKFLTTIPKWAGGGIEWAQFTPHKQIFGVLAIAQCFDEEDALLVESEFKQVTLKYRNGLCDSKCIVFGDKKKLEEQLDFRRGFSFIEADLNCSDSGLLFTKKQVVIILGDFFLAMHGVLISRLRCAISNDLGSGSKETPWLMSPFERSNDSEKSYSRKHCLARVRKHVADIYLVAGSIQEAISQYTAAVESLRSNNDWLWLGSAYEGLGCAAIAMKANEPLLQSEFTNGLSWKNSPRINHRHHTTVTKTASDRVSDVVRQQTSASGTCSNHTVEQRSPQAVKKLQGLAEGNRGEFGTSMVIKEPIRVNEREIEVLEEATPNGIDEEEEEDEQGGDVTDAILQRFLQKDYIVDKFTRALHYYGKAGTVAGIPHIEALVKFSKFLASEKRYTLASEILHRVFKVQSFVTEEDKVFLYKTLSSVYTSMGFRRKASMMTHYAALQSFKLCQNYSHPQALYQAYELLKECLPGFSLSLDMDDTCEDTSDCRQLLPKGWPVVQAKVLRDLVLLTKYMKQNASAVRLMCVLLQSLYMHLSSSELEEITVLLEQSATESQENDNFVPFLAQTKINHPVPLTEIPKVRSFKPCNLPDNLYPHRYPGYEKKESQDADSGPFIFSTLRMHRKKKSKEVYWVRGTAVEVSVTIMNPLPFDIKVENMCILSEGVDMETIPFGLVLSPDYEPHNLTLISIPRATGQLKLLGYSAKVFSVESNCIVNIVDHPVIHIVPSLPLLRIRLLAPTTIKPPLAGGAKNRDSIVSILESNNMLEMMDGESSTLNLVIENNGEEIIDTMNLKLHNPDGEFCTFSFNKDKLYNHLPLEAGNDTKLCVNLTTSMPAHLKTVIEDRAVNSPDGGSFIPGLIQPIADLPDLGGDIRIPNHSQYDDKAKTLPAGRKSKASRRFPTFTLHRTGMLGRGKKAGASTTEDADLDIFGKAVNRRCTSPSATLYSVAQSERRYSGISASSTIDSLALETESQHENLPAYKPVSVRFELEYTGGPGAVEGYYRKVQLGITIRVMPAFHFSHFDVLPCTEIADKFVLSFNVANMVSSQMELHCAVHQSPVDGVLSDQPSQMHHWSINGSSSKRVAIELKKFTLTEEKDTSEQERLQNYSKYLTDIVKLTWICPSLGKKSSQSISAFTIPPEMLAIMKHIPVQFGVTLNDVDISTGQRTTSRFPVNSRINLSIVLTSIHSSSLSNLLLIVQPYQENYGESHDYSLVGKLVHSGSLRVLIPWLAPSECYQCSLTLMFMCKGMYNIRMKCSQQTLLADNLQPSSVNSNKDLSGKDNSPSLEKYNRLDQYRHESRNNSMICVSPIFPSPLHSRSPLPSLHSPTPVYDKADSQPPLQVYTLQDTLIGPLTTLDIY